MQSEVISRKADLNKRPKAQKFDDSITHVSVGDMHGNALKLIYTLIQEGFLTLNNDDYNALKKIYNKPVSKITKRDVEKFQDILYDAT